MQEIINYSIDIILFTLYIIITIALVSLPLWGFKLVETRFTTRQKALKTNNKTREIVGFQIIASIGTTTAGVFMIQILPLIFSVINDIGGEFSVPIVYGDHISSALPSEYLESFYAITAQLGDVMQTTAPMAAVGLGGYNLLNNISRGLPAILSNNEK
jgi:hypothetical protein